MTSGDMEKASNGSTTAAARTTEEKDEKTDVLPKLSPADFQIFNRLAEMMEEYHNRFRRTWNELYHTASSGTSLLPGAQKQYVTRGLQFCSHLKMHHDIEETYFFPVLAKKMPAFRKELELLTQHKAIHAGLLKLQDYLRQSASSSRGTTAEKGDFSLDKVREIMQSFGAVLWQHLDEEVKTLGAENMRRFWSREEMLGLPF
ncbi:MAG: hypothetical protein M1838_001047 [Thelocarpon superellum]|nr:MAG: hypothetical protein M1838_001047 [Thelocarpon superellum]